MRLAPIILITLTLAISAFAQQSLRTGSHAPAFAVDGMDGNTYDLNDYKGKVVVITFWSSKCTICHEEIPKLNRLAAHYKNQNVVFLALTMDNEAKVSAYIKNTPFDFTILPNSFGVVLQYADRDRAGNIDMGFPAYYIVDQTGGIQMKTSGWDKTAGIDSQISKLLASQNSHDSTSTVAAMASPNK